VTSESIAVATPENVLELHDLSISFAGPHGPQLLVTGIDLALVQGEIVSVVGESGSGKSITALACLGLLPRGLFVSGGTISIGGVDCTDASDSTWRKIRGPEVAMIFQDPMTSLDPCFRVGSQIVETIRAHEDVSTKIATRRAVDIMGAAGVPEARQRFDQYPHELSGGLRQRVMIAAALALEPKVLIADEPTTALDVTTQASIIGLVQELSRDRAMSVLWITHDLGVVSQLAQRVVVMYAGEFVELGSLDDVFQQTSHHYTDGLLDSARYQARGERFGFIAGGVPEPAAWPAGCRFSTRCSAADELCNVHPGKAVFGVGHMYRCHHPLEVVTRG